MFFRYGSNLVIGTKIKIKITFPSLESPVFAAGKVIRVEETEDIPKFKVAIELINIKELHKNII